MEPFSMNIGAAFWRKRVLSWELASTVRRNCTIGTVSRKTRIPPISWRCVGTSSYGSTESRPTSCAWCMHKTSSIPPRFTGSSNSSRLAMWSFCRSLNHSQTEEGSVSPRTVPAEAFGNFLCTIFDEWVSQDVEQVNVQIFEEVARTALGQEHALCIFRKTCGDVPVIEHNGDFFSCDHFVDTATSPGEYPGNATGRSS